MITLAPIAFVRSSRSVVEDDDWDKEQVHVELDVSRISSEALTGLDAFSHVEIVYFMDQVEPAKIETGARHPRNNKAWPKVGILAQRAKNRPNQLGTTVCKVLRVEATRLHVQGLDAVDGTPVLDIKPWVRELGPRGEVSQPAWITELMREYWTRS
jgi:tRNA-Thr(GGU) m(6)t(6)A37 methyltransferase TsaA